jgi:ABC-2 type transport system ATP-binding protein
MQATVEAVGLVKRFGDVTAVAGIDVQVHAGEIFGFLGPNGAGKTTTINLLTSLARPDAGQIRIAGIDAVRHPKAAQALMGVVPDDSNLYPELTGFANLCFCGALYGLRRAERQARARELLDAFGLSEAGQRKFGGYSKGMRRKLTIAAGLIHRPPLLFLDEPTTGIDVAAARQIRQLIAGLRRSGTTIFLTTHYIEEAERLCDRVAFVVAGRVVQTAPVADLLQPLQGRHLVQVTVAHGATDLGPALAAAFPALQVEAVADGVLRAAAPEPVRVGDVVRFLADRGAEVLEARRMQASLEEVFVRVTGIEATAMRRDREKGGGPGA